MQESIFGLNGVELDPDKLDEFQLYTETKNRDFEHALLMVIWLAASGGLLIWSRTQDIFDSLQVGIACLMGFGWIFGFVYFSTQAKQEHRLPNSLFERRQHRHVSGLGALVSIALVLFVVAAAVTGELFHPDFRIPEWFGHLTLVIMSVVLGVLILAPHIGGIPSFSAIASALRRLFSFLAPLGLWIGTIDSWLVLIVAPAVGAACKSWPQRYVLIFTNLFGALLFAWFAPAPFGLIGILWSLLAAVSIVRRWAWIEHDRERGRGKDLSNVFAWRAGSKQDLRDEALWALLLLVISLPIGMRQVHLTYPAIEVFSVPSANIDDPTAWFGFFGVELLKAIPFIDWSDIYAAEGDTRIRAAAAVSMHTVFAARIVIDLIFLAAVVQAVTISVAFARQRTRFLAGDPEVTFLDERIEKSELSKLAIPREGDWEFDEEKINKFKRYDTTQLSLLRLNANKGSHLHAAIDEIFRRTGHEWEPPQDLLIELSTWSRPEGDKLMLALDQIERQKVIDLPKLMVARQRLSKKGGIENVRRRVAKILVNQVPPSLEKVQALVEIAIGERRDSLAPVREVVLSSLKALARNHDQARLALYAVARSDPASSLRDRATKLLEKLGYSLTDDVERKAIA